MTIKNVLVNTSKIKKRVKQTPALGNIDGMYIHLAREEEAVKIPVCLLFWYILFLFIKEINPNSDKLENARVMMTFQF